MKKLSLLLSLFTVLSYSQNLKIIYNIRYHVNLDTITKAPQKEYYSHILNGINDIKGVLNIKGLESNFEQQGNMTKFKSNKNLIDNYYTDQTKKSVYELNLTDHNNQYVKLPYDNMYYNFSDFNWQLTKKTKKIGKYLCYKAVGVKKSVKVEVLKRNFSENLVAWYCPEIPYSFGPELFAGLPGLVFEAYNANGKGMHWLVDKIIRNHKSEIIKPKGKSLHYVEAEKLMLEEFKNFMKKIKK